jgi:hypothetical protein
MVDASTAFERLGCVRGEWCGASHNPRTERHDPAMRRSLLPTLTVALILCACSDAPSVPVVPALYFPTAGSESMMQALFRGPLVVRDDCVLAGESGNYMLPIWQEGFSVGRDDEARVVVRNADGATVAIEGEVFEMGGGYIAEFEPKDRVDPRDGQLQQVAEMTGNTIPERCLGPDVYGVWWAGETRPISA